MALAMIGPIVILCALLAGGLGLASTSDVQEVALGAGETPGMLTFGALFLCSPVQWLTGRSQVRVRKYFGIVFFLLALSNGAMFLWQEGVGHLFAQPLVIAGLVALVLATPLFLTSSRASQRLLGMRRWRLLHKLTYVIAAALLVHVALIPDFGPGALMIVLGFVARVPAVRRRLESRHYGASR